MDPKQARAAFEAAFPALVAAKEKRSALFDINHPMNVYMRAEMDAELAKRGLPKTVMRARKDEAPITRTVRLLEKHAPEALKAVRACWNEAGAIVYGEIEAECEAAEAALVAAAEHAEVRAGAEPLLYHTSHSSTWNSQGYGAKRYARGAAENVAAEAAAHGVKVEVVEVNPHRSGGTWPIDHADYEVRVWVESEMDLEILRCKPGLSLREWVRACWKRQVNPRVFNPYLPVGYEEKVGLDYHGNDLKA